MVINLKCKRVIGCHKKVSVKWVIIVTTILYAVEKAESNSSGAHGRYMHTGIVSESGVLPRPGLVGIPSVPVCLGQSQCAPLVLAYH